MANDNYKERREDGRRRIRNVRLLPPDDQDYRAHQSVHAQAAVRLGKKLEPDATHRASKVFETIVCEKLALMVDLSRDRILGYELQEGRFGYKSRYLELDALSGSLESNLRVYEIKASHSFTYACDARKQLHRAENILNRMCAAIELVVLWVDTGCEPFDENALQRRSFTVLETLEDLTAWTPDEGRPAFCRVPGDEAWQWASSLGLEVDDEIWRQAKAERRASFEAREKRKELKEAGIPPEEWPEEVKEPQRRRATGVYSVGPESEPETVFGEALRKAKEKPRP